MARLVPVRCPNCGANVRIDPARDIATCEYCKTSSFVQTRARPVPEAVLRDNSPVIDVEAFRSSSRSGLVVVWVYAVFAVGVVVIALVAFVVSWSGRSTAVLAPSKDDDTLEKRLGEGPGSHEKLPSVAETTRDSAPSVSTPKFKAGDVVVSGRLSSEVVQKVVSQHYNRFRLCHEQAERRGGNAYGTVTFRFVIGRDGGVSHTTLKASSVQSGPYVECVETVFGGMLFPKPPGGIVTVVYPLVAAPG